MAAPPDAYRVIRLNKDFTSQDVEDLKRVPSSRKTGTIWLQRYWNHMVTEIPEGTLGHINVDKNSEGGRPLEIVVVQLFDPRRQDAFSPSCQGYVVLFSHLDIGAQVKHYKVADPLL